MILRERSPKLIATHGIAQFGHDFEAFGFDVGIGLGREAAGEVLGHVGAGRGVAVGGFGEIDKEIAGGGGVGGFGGAG